MKSFTLILLLSCFALAMTARPRSTDQTKPAPTPAQVRSLAVRRLALPQSIKEPLKWAVSTIVNTAITCAAGAIGDKLSTIPMFKDLPVAKGIEKLESLLKAEIKKHTDSWIDALRRARMVRRRMFDLGDIGDVINDGGNIIKDGVVKTGEVIGEGGKAIAEVVNKGGQQVIKAGEWVGGVAKDAGDLVEKLGGLVGDALCTGLANAGCPLVANVVFQALDKALLAVGFPFTPPCIKQGIEDGCKTGVHLFFKKKRILRRLASLKRDLKNF